jgi:hypothetical protein
VGCALKFNPKPTKFLPLSYTLILPYSLSLYTHNTQEKREEERIEEYEIKFFFQIIYCLII